MAERITEGVKLEVDKTTIPGATWTTLAEITEIDLPSESVPALDKTVLADSSRRFRAGLHDPGDVGFSFNFDPDNADHIWLQSQMTARTERAWRITIPVDGATTNAWTCTFPGFLTEFAPTASGVDEFVTASVTVKVSGPVVYAKVV